MIAGERQIRLTSTERQQLKALTGADPGRITSRRQLEAFVQRHAQCRSWRGPGACLARRLLLSFLEDGASAARTGT